MFQLAPLFLAKEKYTVGLFFHFSIFCLTCPVIYFGFCLRWDLTMQPLTGLNLTMQTRLTSNSQEIRLCLPSSAGIKGVPPSLAFPIYNPLHSNKAKRITPATFRICSLVDNRLAFLSCSISSIAGPAMVHCEERTTGNTKYIVSISAFHLRTILQVSYPSWKIMSSNLRVKNLPKVTQLAETKLQTPI